jgi:trigger factor
MEQFREQYRDSAYNRVKTQLVLEAISKAETIEVTEDDREKEYQKLADQYKMNLEDIKKSFGSGFEQLDSSILTQKTIDMLMEEAIMVERAATDEELGHNHDSQNNNEEKKEKTE